MSRSAAERRSDIETAIERCRTYRSHLTDQDPEIADMSYDAILRNLAVIGEAVKSLPVEVTSEAPDIPWASIAGLRNVVVHEYFRVDRNSIIDIVDNHLPRLRSALDERA